MLIFPELLQRPPNRHILRIPEWYVMASLIKNSDGLPAGKGVAVGLQASRSEADELKSSLPSWVHPQ